MIILGIIIVTFGRIMTVVFEIIVVLFENSNYNRSIKNRGFGDKYNNPNTRNNNSKSNIYSDNFGNSNSTRNSKFQSSNSTYLACWQLE